MIQVDTTEIWQFEVESRFQFQIEHICRIHRTREWLSHSILHRLEHEQSFDDKKWLQTNQTTKDELIYIEMLQQESAHCEIETINDYMFEQTLIKHEVSQREHDSITSSRFQIEAWNSILITFWNILEVFQRDWLHHISDDDKNTTTHIQDNYIDIWNESLLKTKSIQKQKETSIETKSNHNIENKSTEMVLFYYDNQYKLLYFL